ncbi:hypothetical protein BDY21DRAFT_335289 [Lineolata rhizophorae]|uniref:J domain-containing protein n=1 Tax=Lineolata rhizophorae TaxID=578093 RepID=A0A6A6P8X1_9PEZI|nr:hypothetical protein BDY21DRAFT_335289 [Lineolata rhizophorae]
MAPKFEDLADEPPSSIDPYAVLGLEHDASADQVKSAYRKAALKTHPDKVAGDEKEGAHAKFQEVAFAYAVLSDPRRRSRYDATGRTEETLHPDDVDDDFNWTEFYREQFEDVVNFDSINQFASEYKGSEEERNDLLAAYERFKGDMRKMYEVIMLSNPIDDDERFRTILDEAIKKGDVEAFPQYTQESERSRKRRVDEAGKEAKEAEVLAVELEEKKKNGGKKGKGSTKKGAKKDESANGTVELMAMIQKKHQSRASNFLANLEAKYAPKGKKGKRTREMADMDEPPEEAFQKTAERQKKAKIDKNGVLAEETEETGEADDAAEDEGPSRRKTRHSKKTKAKA